MSPRPGLSAGLVQDYLQRPRVQYNIINIHLLGGMVNVPNLMFCLFCSGLDMLKSYEFNLEWSKFRNT